jgi:DNA-binding beta-propeller fold protein YncE
MAAILLRLALVTLLLPAAGCLPAGGADRPSGKLEQTWGRRGLSEGRMQKPRAMAIDQNDLLYVVDMTARIQVFTAEGDFVRGWSTPQSASGKPCGLTFDRDGNLLVADTHYFRMLVYTPLGRLLDDRTIGGDAGRQPGEFSFVTDCVQDSQENYFICEYGDFDRVQKFSRDGQFILQWGSHGSEAGQFVQPRSLAIDENDHIWVADACNHRIQVFDASGTEVKLVRIWGDKGREPGQLSYPYGLALDGKGHVFVCEFGNSRVQEFTTDGQYVGYWGSPGRQEGELYEPWEIAFDSRGKLHVLDTNNHRVQRVRL